MAGTQTLDPQRIAAIVRAVVAEFEAAAPPAKAGTKADAHSQPNAQAKADAALVEAALTALQTDRVTPDLQIDTPKERGEVGGSAGAAAAAAASAKANAPAAPQPVRPYRRARYAGDGMAFKPSEIAKLQALSPARLVQGRVGTRYPTDKAIGLRAEHAVALDAVNSTLPEGFAAALGCIELRSQAADHADYLAYPNKGRRLDPESRALLEQQGTKGADVQIICGDGLAAWALEANGPGLLPALQSALSAIGFSLGKPVLVHHARVGVQDEIGVVLGCKASVILVGERPGLGTGDSLSVYTAFAPKLDQDNAEKDCISNIRPLGIPVEEAATMTAALLKRTFAAGGGGVHLTSQTDAA